jgi:hypothetical protein
MNIIRIKTGYGSKKLIGVQASKNTDLSIYFNEIEIPIHTNEQGKYFFNDKHEPLPTGCMVYENVSISSTSSEPITPIYGDIDMGNTCDEVFMNISIIDPHTHREKFIPIEIKKGRVWFSRDANLGTKMSYAGIV